MLKNLTKHGNSWALIIDKPILDLLKIDPTAPLEISLWYWNAPFHLSAPEADTLKALKVRTLFVHAGTALVIAR